MLDITFDVLRSHAVGRDRELEATPPLTYGRYALRIDFIDGEHGALHLENMSRVQDVAPQVFEPRLVFILYDIEYLWNEQTAYPLTAGVSVQRT